MKKIVLTLIISFLTFFANAQSAKPTKEQTIEYISNTLKDYGSHWVSEDGSSGTKEIVDIDFSGFVLTVTINYFYKYFDQDKKFYSEYSINLNEIEKVEIREERRGVYMLDLYSFNSKKLFKNKTNSDYEGIKQPESIDYKSIISIPAPNDEKLVQAFNHLRKLCGAPEPIKF